MALLGLGGIFVIGAIVIMLNGRPVNDLTPEDRPQVVVEDKAEEAKETDAQEQEEVGSKEDDTVYPNPDQPTAAPTQPPVDAPVASGYSMTQVATHATPDSCWAAVGGSVYDLTTWISRHPGGKRPIEGMCGTDATARFESKHGKSAPAKAALALLKIGELAK